MKRTKSLLLLSIITIGLIFLLISVQPSDTFSAPTIFQQTTSSTSSSSSTFYTSTMSITSTPGFDVLSLFVPIFLLTLIVPVTNRKKNT